MSPSRRRCRRMSTKDEDEWRCMRSSRNGGRRLLSSGVSNQSAIDRFLHEASAVARLNHQNIVTVYDVRGSCPGRNRSRQVRLRDFQTSLHGAFRLFRDPTRLDEGFSNHALESDRILRPSG